MEVEGDCLGRGGELPEGRGQERVRGESISTVVKHMGENITRRQIALYDNRTRLERWLRALPRTTFKFSRSSSVPILHMGIAHNHPKLYLQGI